jgi:predicted RNase H-like HicB family nuclease
VPPAAVLISSAEGSFVVYDPETGTATHGDSMPEAISNLREATESYLEDFPLEQPSQALLTNLEVAAHA